MRGGVKKPGTVGQGRKTAGHAREAERERKRVIPQAESPGSGQGRVADAATQAKGGLFPPQETGAGQGGVVIQLGKPIAGRASLRQVQMPAVFEGGDFTVWIEHALIIISAEENMAKHQTEERMGHLRTTVELEPGEKLALCRCFKSGDFPFCDGTHKTLESNVGPVLVSVVKEEKNIAG